MILQNQIRCNKCGDEPFSAHRHDFKFCKCGAVAVDGGMDYLRRVGEVHGGYTDMSYELDDAIVKECNDAIQWAQDTGRNNLGTLCAVLRVMNKHGKLA
jgi:hypothetical protein